MRKHWGLLTQIFRQFAAPAAACLMLSPWASAQDVAQNAAMQQQPEGRIQLRQQAAVSPTTVPAAYSPVSHQTVDPEQVFEMHAGESGWVNSDGTLRPRDLKIPNMIGGSLAAPGNLNFFSASTVGALETSQGTFDIPGSGRVANIAENNSPIPRDRFYFAYNHFNNAFGSSTIVDPNDVDMDMNPIPADVRSRGFNQDRFTLGLEKALFWGETSVEFRVPLITQVNTAIPGVTDPTTPAVSYMTNDPTGNLTMILKKVLWDWYGADSSGVISSGMGFTFKHAEGATVQVGDTRFLVDDSGIHLQPYIALTMTHRQGWFFQLFLESDFSTDKYNVVSLDGNGTLGATDIPDVFKVDVGGGCWLWQRPQRRFLKGVAAMLEYHYAGEKQNNRPIAFTAVGATTTNDIIIGGFDSRRDISNLTTGLHVNVTDHVNCRVAGIVPLQEVNDRTFDGGVAFQLDILR